MFAEAIVPLIFASLCFSCELPVKRAERNISQPARDVLLRLLELAESGTIQKMPRTALILVLMLISFFTSSDLLGQLI